MFTKMKAVVGRQGKVLARLAADDSGVAAIEYALLAALVGVVAIGAMQVVGHNLSSVFNQIASDL